ncbi:complement C1q subcomponent subunit C-like isoform X4 [Mytilus californianus]|uniref:complement C1q subcomponent subunit C-like isoform X3 n=1 Tax=Mytilus californianus TaxID=6549 RepID=UPI0022478366|nr:complement C1q subcomponent subunit C-like isoform X3 [Mytilus californianus]XP_052102068.1 complement C1q subcomponent subunit C-like isoform X4 [Mytilus californianus]
MIFSVLIASLIYGNLVQCNKQEIIEDLKNIIFKIKKSGDFGAGQTSIPAFTATLSKDFTPPLNQIIKFDSVKTNVGGHYSSSTGVFTPPRNGLYMISATIRSTATKYLHCELWVNDVMKEKLFGNNYSTGTANAVLQLKRGDRVFIKKDNRSGEYMLGRDWSMFSGYFIA